MKKYENYKGVVLYIFGDECEVTVTNKAENNSWKRPKKVDHIWNKNEDVVAKIEAPILKSEKSKPHVPSMKSYYNA